MIVVVQRGVHGVLAMGWAAAQRDQGRSRYGKGGDQRQPRYGKAGGQRRSQYNGRGGDKGRRSGLRGLLGLAAVGSVLAGCAAPATLQFGNGSHHAARVHRRVSIAARERSAVTRQALLFMRRFKRGEFGAQWEELAPTARGMWPSRSARAGMLGHKFGSAGVDSVRVGVPTSGAVWTSQENPRISAASTWRVPVTVGFRDARRLKPSGVASAYAGLDLYLSVSPSHRRALVVGEGPASTDAPVLMPARPPTSSARVPILMYHLVGPYPERRQWTDDYGYSIEYGLTVPPPQFAGEMKYLHDHGYHAISLTRLADSLLYGLGLPSHPVALTFDDGRESPWTYAVPLLRRYGFTATFFVCSGFVGETNQTSKHLNVQHYMSWTQVTDLARGGFWIEDHGQKDLNVLWGLRPRTLQTEVQQSARLLTAHTHQPIQFIAYTGALWPYPVASQWGPEQAALFSRLAGFGYVGGVVDAHVPSVQETSTQLWQLPRVRVTPGESMGEFVASLG